VNDANEAPQTPPVLVDDPLWYKDAIIYEVHVKAFFDSNNDGIGDFPGLTAKLDYIQSLGVNTIWVLPFYPSPLRDDGYDIADYHNIHPDYGTRKDFQQFVREAHRRGLRVITELVINHTSDQHPWFQAARSAPPGSAKRDFYVWSDTDKKFPETRIIFTDTEKSNWAWDETAQAYYWHRFFSHQPDLNHNNPEVVKAVTRVMRFWLDLGVDGLRLDAIPYLCVREGTRNENLPETHEVIRQMRAVVDDRYRNRMFLAEANQWPEDVRDYFGNGDECHVAYHFPLMPRMYMAIAQEDRHPITEIMAQTPDIPDNCQWAIFLRNHDELTLEMVTSRERDYMYQMYAADPRARLNLGIRRRLAPLMENDPDRIKLMNSLLLSLPGSPIIYYGDEIGMGDNIFLGDRNGVRTPMQWSPDRNAGFSRADPQRLFLPPVMDPVYGFEAVNVEAQLREPSSLLNWMRRLLSVRKSVKAFGRGQLVFLRPGNRKILAFLREYGDEIVLCVANLARTAQPVELDLSRFKGRVPLELLGRTVFPPIGELPYLLTLHGHSFYWFQLMRDMEAPPWHEERLPREELPVLVLFDGWNSLFPDRVVPWRIAMAEKVRLQLETDALPRFMTGQRWYPAKDESLTAARLVDHVAWAKDGSEWLLGLYRTGRDDADSTLYFLPLTLAWEDGEDTRLRALLPASLARVRQQSHTGILADATADEQFCRAVLDAIGESLDLDTAGGTLAFRPTRAFAQVVQPEESLVLSSPGSAGTNSTVRLGDRLFLKFYRQLHEGRNPELEIGQYLTDVAHFAHSVPVLGSVEYRSRDGATRTLALLQEYIDNQGDGWTHTLDYLERFLEQRRGSSDPLPVAHDAHAGHLALMATLAQRTAALHAVLARPVDHPDFAPEPVTAHDLKAWSRQVHHDATKTLDLLAARPALLTDEVRTDTETLLSRRTTLQHRIDACLPDRLDALKTRYHGDYHLGQVLLVRNDFIIIDFEGEPARRLDERRAKHSPLRDVAGMLRSFSYAAGTALARLPTMAGEDRAPLEAAVRDWERATRAQFLETYLSSMRVAERAAVLQLLDLFLIEKALYEIRYELAHRPAWLPIPLRGLLAMLPVPEG